MLHQLYSEGSCSRYSPTQRQKKRPSSSTLSELKLPHPRPSINHRSCSFAESTRKEKKVRVNVSGKKYELSLLELSKYPDSLLSNPLLSGKYYDNKTKEYFFDRSRVVFDCIYNFYHSKGEISLPKDYPEQLLADELHFFGLFTHLKEKDKENLVLPTLLEKEIPSPKNMLQRKIWQMLENPESSLHATIICITTLLVILLSIAVLCVDTLLIPPVPPGEEKAGQTNSTINWTAGVTPEQEHLNDILFTIETCCVAYFTTELVLRFLVSPTKLLFFRSVLNLIDVLAVAPYYAMLIIEVGLSSTGAAALRIFRLSRVFRVLKVSRYVSGMEVLAKTMRAAIYDVWMVVFLTMIGTTLFASCVYYFEQFGDPDTDFESIPMSIWWAIITISTVGYGDLAPRTLLGRVTGAMCAVSGVLLIAPLLPIIYERWERFYMLDQEAKLIRTALKKRQDLEGKEEGAQGRRGSTKEAREGAKEEVDAAAGAAGGVPATIVDGEGDDEAFLTRQRSLSSTVGESGIEVISDDPEIQKEIKNEDDVVWAHIRAASLKRMQSQTSFKRLKKEGSISEVPEPPPSAKGSEDSDSSDENYDNDDDDTGGHVDNDAGDKKGSKVGSSPKPDRGSSADSAAA